jgi:hypothetical protein
MIAVFLAYWFKRNMLGNVYELPNNPTCMAIVGDCA